MKTMSLDIIIGLSLACFSLGLLFSFYRISVGLDEKLSRHLDQIDTLIHAQKLDRAEHRKSMSLIRDDLVVISSSVGEIRRIARSCEHRGFG